VFLIAEGDNPILDNDPSELDKIYDPDICPNELVKELKLEVVRYELVNELFWGTIFKEKEAVTAF
jgi:hypothetical protein